MKINMEKYEEIMNSVTNDPEIGNAFAKTIVKKLGLDVYPHIHVLELLSGIIPMSLAFSSGTMQYIRMPLDDPKWEEVKITASDTREFIDIIVSGAECDDPFCVEYAKILGLIG